MDGGMTFKRNRRLTGRRGAVLLLSVYFASLLLLILSGISLQRTMTETKAAQVSRDQGQVFYVAEGAMDFAVKEADRKFLLDGVSYVLDGATYPRIASEGQASFSLATVSGAVFNSGKQVVVRRIDATSNTRSDGTGAAAGVSAYVQETSPVEGIWANRIIVAHGGAAFRDLYLTGDMRANRGAFSTVLADPADAEPADSLLPEPLLKISGLAKAKDHEDMVDLIRSDGKPSYISQEMLSLKNGYLWVKGRQPKPVGFGLDHSITESRDSLMYQGLDYPAVNYDPKEGPQNTPLPHVEGQASLGAVKAMIPMTLPADMNPLLTPENCSAHLALKSEKVELKDGFQPVGNLKDLSGGNPDKPKADGKIVLCVQSIYPDGYKALESTLKYNKPPELTFNAPTTIYVVGSQHLDVADIVLQDPPPQFAILKVIAAANYSAAHAFVEWGMNDPAQYPPGVQRVWDMSVGAKISVEDHGRAIPNGMTLIWAKPPQNKGYSGGSPGIVWVKPGKFSGSVFAPGSLVLFRERDDADRYEKRNNEDIFVPLEVGSIVGDEVVIELKDDHIKFTSVAGLSDSQKPEWAETKYLGGWMNRPVRPAGATAPVSDTVAEAAVH